MAEASNKPTVVFCLSLHCFIIICHVLCIFKNYAKNKKLEKT